MYVACYYLFFISRTYPIQIQAPPALGLSHVKDYFRFVIKFFEIISISAPHIYHTALPLSPQGSTIHKLYEQHAYPFVRVVHGVPFSWEPVIATMQFKQGSPSVTWSPCSKFLAVEGNATIDIMDAVTLNELNTFKCSTPIMQLSFSPGGHLLISLSDQELISWDLQTGGLASTIKLGYQNDHYYFLPIYSTDGKSIAFVSHSGVMYSYNIVSGTHLYSYTLPEGYLKGQIWAHGECIQFATRVQGSIKIWEIGFGTIDNLVEVQSFLLSDKILPSSFLRFFLSLSQLASFEGNNVLVWDVQNSEPLLDYLAKDKFEIMTFSSDGCFFACTTYKEFYLWKKSPVGYTLHQNLTLENIWVPEFLSISPNGESAILCDEWSANLLHTRDPTTSSPSKLIVQGLFEGGLFEISTDETMAALGQGDEDIVIIDLKSGDPQLVIDRKYGSCVRVTGSMVVVVYHDKMVAWDIPSGGSALNVRANTNNSAHMTTFDHLPLHYYRYEHSIAISPDLKYVTFMLLDEESASHLRIYDMWSGECLTSTVAEPKSRLHFTPDSHGIWSVSPDKRNMAIYAITKERQSHLINLECLDPMMYPLKFTQLGESCYGYQDVDGWILNSSKERLLWLPQHWQYGMVHEAWQRQFFKFSLFGSSEAVLLECLK